MLLASVPIEMARYLLGDSGKITFSDDDMVARLNSCLDKLYLSISAVYSPILEAEVALTLEDGSAELPDDYHQMVGVFDEDGVELESKDENFSIMGTKICSDYPSLILKYLRFPDPVSAVDDPLPLPASFRTLLRDMLVATTKDDPALVNALAYNARRFVARKDIGKLAPLHPWR